MKKLLLLATVLLLITVIIFAVMDYRMEIHSRQPLNPFDD